MKSLITLCGLVLCSYSSDAAISRVMIVQGEQRTGFEFDLREKAPKVLVNSNADLKNFKISQKDSRLIGQHIKQIQGLKSNDLKYCPRSYMLTISGKKATAACIDSPTPVSSKMAKLVNFLTTTSKTKDSAP